MVIIKKVKLNKNEIALIKASLILRGETFRSWSAKCMGKETRTTAPVSNILTTGVVTRKVYEKVLKPLNLPFFKDFKWEEEITHLKTKIDLD